MNQTRILLSVHTVTVLFALTIVQPAVHAASLTWDANGTTAGQTDGGGGWLNANLWWTGSANQTWSSGSDAVFGNGGAGGTVSLASPTTVNSLTMNSFSGTYTLGSAGQTITLASGLTRNSGAGAVAISSPVTLGGAQTWLNNSANTLTISGAVDNGGNLLTIDGSGPTSFGAVTLSGAGGLTKNGTGNLNLNGPTVSISGSLVINGGEVLEYNMGIGTGNLTLNGGILEDYWGGNLTRTLGSGAGQVQVPGGVSGFSGQGTTGLTLKINNNAAYEVVWGAASEAWNTNATGFFNPSTLVLQGPWANAGGNVNFQNKVDLNGTTRTIAVNKDPGTTTGNATISGAIRSSSGTAGLIKTGPGALILSGANTYNGATTVNQGTMRFNSIGAIGGSGRNVIGTNGVTVAAGYAMDNTFLSRLAENTNFFTVALGAASSANLDFNTSAGATLPNASLGAVGAYTYSGTLTPNGTTYRLGGGGGTLTVSSALTAAGNSLVVGGAIQLNAANNFSGDTLVQSGTLSVNTNLALQNSAIDTSGSGVIAILSAATTPTIGGLKGSKNITALITTGYGSVTNLTLNPGAGVTNSYSGVIANGAPGMALTKSGSGTQILSGANTYSGNTTVSGGTLALSQPTLSTNSTVTVASDAVLRLDFAGTNTVSGLVLNGVSQASGVYNSTTAAPYLTGTGTLRVVLYDTDGDGIPDTWMMKYFGHLTGLAADKSRAQDDADSDGLTNLQEYQLGTNPVLADTDGDGISDGDEVNIYHTNPLLADTDGDGLSDYEELFVYHTDPLKWDTDGDGLSDGDEVKIYHTNPLVADTDGDGVGDWYEVMATYTSPTNAADKPSIPYPLPRPDGSKGATNKPVKVFVLSGQSNMVGMGDVGPLGTVGTLSTIVKQQNRFPDLLNTNGNWTVWSNVMYRGVVTAIGNAPLQPGQGSSSGTFGPELGFGRVMGYYLNEPVLIIKASQGNRGLFWDILPPGSPPYTNGTTVYAGYGQSPNSWPVGGGPSPFVWYAGKQYDDFFLANSDMGAPAWVIDANYPSGCQVKDHGVTYLCGTAHTSSAATEPGVGAQWATCWSVYTIENVTTVLDNFATQYPKWAAQGFQIAGFGWWQGDWDAANGAISANRYETNMVNLIKTVRQYYINRYPNNCPTNVPWVVATMDYDGWAVTNISGDVNFLTVDNAQLAVGDPVKHPEFAGIVKSVETRGYWRTNGPNMGQWYHEWHNAEDYMLVGDVLGRGMASMLSAGTTSDYSTWAAQWPGANLSDPNADLDGDGLSNDYERIWGLNPTNAASRNPFTSTTGLAAGTFRYTRRALALSGLSYTVWTSTNLATWTQDTGAVQAASAPVNGVETVTVNLSPALLGGPRLYVRMRAQ